MIEPRQPTSAIGPYLAWHEHAWTEIGAHHTPSGRWTAMFACWCGSVIADGGTVVHVDPGSTCVDHPRQLLDTTTGKCPVCRW